MNNRLIKQFKTLTNDNCLGTFSRYVTMPSKHAGDGMRVWTIISASSKNKNKTKITVHGFNSVPRMFFFGGGILHKFLFISIENSSYNIRLTNLQYTMIYNVLLLFFSVFTRSGRTCDTNTRIDIVQRHVCFIRVFNFKFYIVFFFFF